MSNKLKKMIKFHFIQNRVNNERKSLQRKTIFLIIFLQDG